MSTQQEPLTYDVLEQLARIERAQVETGNFAAEQRKLSQRQSGWRRKRASSIGTGIFLLLCS